MTRRRAQVETESELLFEVRCTSLGIKAERDPWRSDQP